MNQYLVLNNIKNTVLSLVGQATEGQTYSVTLVAKYGYILPKQITVTVEGIPTPYIYTAETGVLQIEGQYVTGDIQIEGEVTTERYTVTALDNITVTQPVAVHGEHFQARITAERGSLPESITAKVNGRSLTSSYYFYSNQTGELVINRVDVVGDIEIGLCR